MKGLVPVYRIELHNGGLDFMLADFGSRRLVFAWPRVVPSRLLISNMDAIGTLTTVPLAFSDVPASAWNPRHADMVKPSTNVFVNSPVVVERAGREGRWLALALTSSRGSLFAGYRLDAKAEREILGAGDMSDCRVQGDFGLANLLGQSDALLADFRNGKVFASGVDIGLPAPQGTNQDKGLWRLVARDGATSVMHLAMGPSASSLGDGRSRLYVYRRTSGEWMVYDVPGSKPRVKMIEGWVIGVAVSEALGRESPGALERQQYMERYPNKIPRNRFHDGRLPTDQVFAGEGSYLPGVLFLIEAATGRYFEIRTAQGDSEVLLVHGGTVYYRINDDIYAAPIRADSIGPGELIVHGGVVPDIHWAFWGASK